MIVDRLFYPTTQQYRIDEESAQFILDNHSEYTEVKHDVMSERYLLTDMMLSIEPEDVVFDIGANIGTHTCFLGQKLTTGQIHAFEPLPANVKTLQKNTSLNNINVIVEPYALGGGNSPKPLFVDTAGKEAHLTDGESSTEQLIRVMSGDTLVNSGILPDPNILKIDVEGAELDVLRGFKQTLRSPSCRLIYCEIHPKEIFTHGLSESEVSDLKELLISCGFNLSTIKEDVDKDKPYHLKAELG